MSNCTASEKLAAFAASVQYDALPKSVQQKVLLHLLDTLGVGLAATVEEFAMRARSAIAALVGRGRGRASVWGASSSWPAPWAALFNGMLAHGLDFDDTHAEAVLHVSTTVVPAALAVAEATATSGGEFLAAIAAGMEVNARIGIAAPGGFHDRGFHPTGVCGAYGAAVAAARAMRLDAGAMVHTLGLAGSQAAGTLEFLGDGSWSKRLHAGWAAHAGIVAAQLGREGFVGPRATLEGRFGLYRTHLGDAGWDVSAATRDLGQNWRLLEISLKPYPACHMVHAHIDAARVLRGRPGFRVDEIERIEADIHERAVPVVCEPLEAKRAPRTDYEAKFSLPYVVASMLVRGHVGVADFTPAAIADEAVRALAARVEYRPDASSQYPRYFDGGLRIRFRNGDVWEHREAINRGHPDKPLGRDEVIEKFRRNVARVWQEKEGEALLVAVQALPRAKSLRQLQRALRVPARPQPS